MEARASYAEGRVRHLVREHNQLVDKWNGLLRKWNDLVERINQLGGESFLQGATEKHVQFTADELQRLIQLCHPDKHDGKQMATEMTAKLLKMKQSIA
jgi:hypothetical protein